MRLYTLNAIGRMRSLSNSLKSSIRKRCLLSNADGSKNTKKKDREERRLRNLLKNIRMN